MFEQKHVSESICAAFNRSFAALVHNAMSTRYEIGLLLVPVTAFYFT